MDGWLDGWLVGWMVGWRVVRMRSRRIAGMLPVKGDLQEDQFEFPEEPLG